MHYLIKVKIHLHHSHIAVEILGYTHDFSKWTVRENGFDIFFLIKCYCATAWGTKDLNIGGTNLTHINFGNIGGEVKFIDTTKYYQKSLAELASALAEDEKNSVKLLTIQFQHHYFSGIWKYLEKNKILDIISEGKGIIPYEKIVHMNSMFLTPENNVFFEKTEFYSDLKQKAVSDSDYES